MEIKFKSKVAASVFAALLFGGVMETANAAEHPKLRIAEGIAFHEDGLPYYTAAGHADGEDHAANDPVLKDDSEEKKLFLALKDQHINILSEELLSPARIRSLHKALRLIVERGLTADVVEGLRNEKRIRARLGEIVKDVNIILRKADTDKAATVRKGISAATVCINSMNTFFTGINSKIEARRNPPEKLIAAVNKIADSVADSEISKILPDELYDQGESGKELAKLRNEITRLRDLLPIILKQALQKLTVPMETMHKIITDMSVLTDKQSFIADIRSIFTDYDTTTKNEIIIQASLDAFKQYVEWLDADENRVADFNLPIMRENLEIIRQIAANPNERDF